MVRSQKAHIQPDMMIKEDFFSGGSAPGGLNVIVTENRIVMMMNEKWTASKLLV